MPKYIHIVNNQKRKWERWSCARIGTSHPSLLSWDS
jgi:hypothetical protein